MRRNPEARKAPVQDSSREVQYVAWLESPEAGSGTDADEAMELCSTFSSQELYTDEEQDWFHVGEMVHGLGPAAAEVDYYSDASDIGDEGVIAPLPLNVIAPPPLDPSLVRPTGPKHYQRTTSSCRPARAVDVKPGDKIHIQWTLSPEQLMHILVFALTATTQRHLYNIYRRKGWDWR